MKRLFPITVLAIGLLLGSQQQASAWSKFNFGVGFNIGFQGGGNSVLWGMFRGAQVPDAYNGGYGDHGPDAGHGHGGDFGPGPGPGPDFGHGPGPDFGHGHAGLGDPGFAAPGGPMMATPAP